MVSHRKSTEERPEVPRLTAPREVVEQEIVEQIEKGRSLLPEREQIRSDKECNQLSGELGIWQDYCAELLRRRFSTEEYSKRFSSNAGPIYTSSATLRTRRDGLYESRDQSLERLESIKRSLPLIDEPQPRAAVVQGATSGPIFVVHGQNETKTHEVQRFLTEVTGRLVQVLHEQPNRGATLIEKFERHAEQAAFAVVVLTADDIGGSKGTEKLVPRARQNVVFELGFFFGSHGRSRVAVLYEEGIEQPSDIRGLVYIALDDQGAWKVEMARELEAANIKVDFNKATPTSSPVREFSSEWHDRAAEAVADLNVFWPKVDPYSVRSRARAVRSVREAVAIVEEDWNPLRKKLEFLTAGHPGRDVREKTRVLINKTLTLLREISMLREGHVNEGGSHPDEWRQARELHAEGAKDIDALSEALHLGKG